MKLAGTTKGAAVSAAPLKTRQPGERLRNGGGVGYDGVALLLPAHDAAFQGHDAGIAGGNELLRGAPA